MCRMWSQETLLYEVAFVLHVGLGSEDIPNSLMKLGQSPTTRTQVNLICNLHRELADYVVNAVEEQGGTV